MIPPVSIKCLVGFLLQYRTTADDKGKKQQQKAEAEMYIVQIIGAEELGKDFRIGKAAVKNLLHEQVNRREQRENGSQDACDRQPARVDSGKGEPAFADIPEDPDKQGRCPDQKQMIEDQKRDRAVRDVSQIPEHRLVIQFFRYMCRGDELQHKSADLPDQDEDCNEHRDAA